MSNDVVPVLERVQTAKATHRKTGNTRTHQELTEAAQELRYARWLARGGPDQHKAELRLREQQNEALEAAGLREIVAPLRDEHLFARWQSEQDEEG